MAAAARTRRGSGIGLRNVAKIGKKVEEVLRGLFKVAVGSVEAGGG